jgi:hypothetical protein
LVIKSLDRFAGKLCDLSREFHRQINDCFAPFLVIRDRLSRASKRTFVHPALESVFDPFLPLEGLLSTESRQSPSEICARLTLMRKSATADFGFWEGLADEMLARRGGAHVNSGSSDSRDRSASSDH